jgi:catechol-2,3-dioxygenase
VVRDIDASIVFYDAVFGATIMYRKQGFGQIQTNDSNDIIVFEEDAGKSKMIGKSAGILHFGFRLKNPNDLETIANRVVAAGGTIIDKGEFCPGEPYMFFKDLDGYEVEVWYELIS